MISAIVPTIGRAESLERLLASLEAQTLKVDEVIVADGSGAGETEALMESERWRNSGLALKRIAVQPPNAVRQRIAAIGAASGEFLLLLDDDVCLEPGCVEAMMDLLRAQPGTVAVCADFNNQSWAMPTRAWRLYLKTILRMDEGAWQGRVVGPLLRFGYSPTPARPMPMEWIGTGNSLLRRSAYNQAGGFSDFFLHRCTLNEDVDLGLKMSRVGALALCPAARMGHFHAAGGRVSPMVAAEDDLYNRFLVMRRTQGRSAAAAFGNALLYFSIETASNLAGCLLRMRGNGSGARLWGRLRALARIPFNARRAS